MAKIGRYSEYANYPARRYWDKDQNMSLSQAKILLEKINALYKSMALDQGEVTPIERDLMLSYVRQLYEAFLGLEAVSAPAPAKSRPAPPPPPPPPAPEPVVIAPPTPAPIPAPEPVVVAPPPPPTPAAPPPVAVVAPAPVPPPPTAPEPIAPAAEAAPPRIEALFERREARELSEKLGEQRIDDLTKAMAINDRLLYANDLFGKDMKGMNEILDKLNRMRNMDEAKPLLVSLASRYDWPNEERADTARAFIKLVRRKYQ